MIKSFPKADTKLHTAKGMAYHVKTDVFKKQMWFAYERGVEGGGLVALHSDRVRDIVAMNKEDKKPADLKEFMEVVAIKERDYSNVVGQDSLNRWDSLNKKKKRKKKPSGNKPQGENRPQANRPAKPVSNNRPMEKPKTEGAAPANSNRPNKNKRRRPNNKNRGPQDKKSEE